MAISIYEAVDNLSEIAELTDQIVLYSAKEKEEQLQKRKSYIWLDSNYLDKNQHRFIETLESVHDYLKGLYTSDPSALAKADTQHGIEAIMQLVDEAAYKADKYIQLFKSVTPSSAKQLKQYKDLKNLYLNHISNQFSYHSRPIPKPTILADERGIKELQEVKEDRRYELFYFLSETNKPYFNADVLYHIHEVGEFDEFSLEYTGEDPLLKVKDLLDLEMHHTANEIRRSAAAHIDEFYKEGFKQKQNPFVIALHNAIMALMLAANSRNRIYNTEAKSCAPYFRDFQYYLTRAMQSEQYQKYSKRPPTQKDRYERALMNLTHVFCSLFFLREALFQKPIEFLHSFLDQENSALPKGKFLEQLKFQDRAYRELLSQFPNGPLMKALDLLQNGNHPRFNPLFQDNLPSQLYVLENDKRHVSFLKIPCPTEQRRIDQVDVVDEFKAFLRHLKSRLTHPKHLLINLQDATSWQDYARCQALEKLSNEEEFKESFIIVSLPRTTDFYLQKEDYEELNDANDFKKQFENQLLGGAAYGFYFPSSIDAKEWREFIRYLMDLVHKLFFENRNLLIKQNRLDFIEIVYYLITLKLIDLFAPDSLSFTDKDSLDESSVLNAGFYAFTKMIMAPDQWWKGEEEFILWMLYIPTLFVRERIIHQDCFDRMHRCLSHIEAQIHEGHYLLQPEISKLLGPHFFHHFKTTPFHKK